MIEIDQDRGDPTPGFQPAQAAVAEVITTRFVVDRCTLYGFPIGHVLLATEIRPMDRLDFGPTQPTSLADTLRLLDSERQMHPLYSVADGSWRCPTATASPILKVVFAACS